MKRKRSSGSGLGKLIIVVVLLWVAADWLSQAVLQYWQPDLFGAILIFVAIVLFSIALLGEHIKEAL